MKFTKAIILQRRQKFGPALFLALVACSVTFAQEVRTNYMAGTDFSKYHTYAWVNDIECVPKVGGPSRTDPGRPGQGGDRFPNKGIAIDRRNINSRD